MTSLTYSVRKFRNEDGRLRVQVTCTCGRQPAPCKYDIECECGARYNSSGQLLESDTYYCEENSGEDYHD